MVAALYVTLAAMVAPAAVLSTKVPPDTPCTAALKVADTFVPAATAVALAAGETDVTVGAGAGADAGASVAVYKSRLGVPVVAPAITPAVALDTSAPATWDGVRAGFCDSRTAAAPAVCGAAMEVPDMDAVAVVEV